MKHKKLVIMITFIFIFAAICLVIGTYFASLSKPTTISGYAIDKTKDIMSYYLFSDDNLNIGDNFKINGNIDFELDSEYYKRLSSTNSENLKKYNKIKNLSQMDTNFSINQNKNKKEAFITLNEKIKDETLLDTKLYVADSTEYFYVKGVLDSYINNGTCNYFETLNKSNTTKDNIDYIYNFIFKALKNNLKEEYFNQYEREEKIDGSSKSVHEIAIRVDNDLIINVLNGILKDLKDDERANSILTNIYPDFKKIKIKDNAKYLEKNETYDVHVYTSKVLYKPLKYKIVHTNNNKTEEYIYEGSNKGKFYYIKDSSVMYTADVKIDGNDINIDIYDSSNKKIGEFKISRNSNDISISYDLEYNDKKIDIVYSSKFNSIKNSKSYKNKKVLSFKYIVNKESKLNGSIKMNLDISNTPKIMEDIQEVTLRSKLTEEQEELLKNKKTKMKERLER